MTLAHATLSCTEALECSVSNGLQLNIEARRQSTKPRQAVHSRFVLGKVRWPDQSNRGEMDLSNLEPTASGVEVKGPRPLLVGPGPRSTDGHKEPGGANGDREKPSPCDH